MKLPISKKERVIIERRKEISIFFLSARADRIFFNKAYLKSKTEENMDEPKYTQSDNTDSTTALQKNKSEMLSPGSKEEERGF